MKITDWACYGFCLAAGLFLAHFELHTDDTGVELFFIMVAAFLLGCAHPRHAWQWALLVGLWVPAADLSQSMFGKSQPELHGAGGLLAVAAVVTLAGLAASYAGALLRRGIASAVTHV